MQFLQRVVAGDSYRRTRLHDEKGNMVAVAELRRLPRHAFDLALRTAAGRLPQRPWLPSNLLPVLEQLIEPNWRVLEFGSGMSTVWLSRRVADLHSIEHDSGWYSRIKPLVGGVRYELRPPDAYTDVSDYQDGSIDLVVVDGIVRSACVNAALAKVRSGGWVLLDNSDKDASGGDMRDAERAVLAASASHRFFTGFTVGSLNAQQSLLAQLP